MSPGRLRLPLSRNHLIMLYFLLLTLISTAASVLGWFVFVYWSLQ